MSPQINHLANLTLCGTRELIQMRLDNMDAYSQSKLAITMWSRSMALSLTDSSPMIVSVNPRSLHATMMEIRFWHSRKSIHIGADILTQIASDDAFEYLWG
jgi:NAD(P)-dependent dehydrogenase (short-subunit alcohol dehydrogenase family)